MKEGYNVTDTDIRNILLSSKYPMLKFHGSYTTSVTMIPGDTNKYADVTHNLGYVPAFIVFVEMDGKIYNVNALWSTTNSVYAWADTTKIRCGWGFYSGAYNRVEYAQSIPNSDSAWDEYWGSTGFLVVGKKDGNNRNGALRFLSVPINPTDTIISATLRFKFEYKGGSNHLRTRTRGLDEDNCVAFNISDPMPRARTDAYTDNDALITSISSFGIDVKSIVEEIKGRAGWSYGNAMGFVLFNNGSDDDCWAEDDAGTGDDSELSITIQTGNNKTISFRVVVFKDKIA